MPDKSDPTPSEKSERAEDSGAPGEDAPAAESPPKRRDFLQKAGGVLVGGAVVACPAVIGVMAVSDPLIRQRKGASFVKLTTLEALPEDGTPQVIKVVVDKIDAWTVYEDLPLGLVYARRTPEGEVIVHSAICPHAGCAVEFRDTQPEGMHYYCPCHESSFRVDGSRLNPENPSKRGLDTLEVDEEKLAEGEIWVKFQKFKANIAEKKPLS